MQTKPCPMLKNGCYSCEHPTVTWCPACSGWYCEPHDHAPQEQQKRDRKDADEK